MIAGVPGPLQLADGGIAADGNIQVAIARSLLEKTDVPGVQPVEAAGDDDLFSARVWKWTLRRRETIQLGGRDDPVANTGRGAESTFCRGVFSRIDHPNVRPEPVLQGKVIRLDRPIHQDHPIDRADGGEHVQPLGLGEFRQTPHQPADALIRPKQDRDIPQPGGFLQKTHIPRAQIVKCAADEDLRHARQAPSG